jgi:hypothetical protein
MENMNDAEGTLEHFVEGTSHLCGPAMCFDVGNEVLQLYAMLIELILIHTLSIAQPHALHDEAITQCRVASSALWVIRFVRNKQIMCVREPMFSYV